MPFLISLATEFVFVEVRVCVFVVAKGSAKVNKLSEDFLGVRESVPVNGFLEARESLTVNGFLGGEEE
jgi:hypothetical protein